MVDGVHSPEIVVGCTDLDAEVEFFRTALGWRIERVSPADDPTEVVVAADGTRLLLRREAGDRPVRIVATDPAVEPGTRTSPGGTTIEHRPDVGEPVIPPADQVLSIVRAADGESAVGRAGMHYRDLLPSRWGGRFIASHITIPGGGEVGDWVHHHRIRFQLIVCAAGWVDVVYEDQGEPFRMHPGDCVLQPPGIRHRVLRASPGLEVVEIGCPAVHDTFADHELELPTGVGDPARLFGGQRFVRHVAASGEPERWVVDVVRAVDSGVGAATNGLAGVLTLRADPSVGAALRHSGDLRADGEFAMFVVLAGSLHLDVTPDDQDTTAVDLVTGDAVAVPAASCWSWSDWTDDLALLLVTLPADAVRPATWGST